jgi:hypothetical protein
MVDRLECWTLCLKSAPKAKTRIPVTRHTKIKQAHFRHNWISAEFSPDGIDDAGRAAMLKIQIDPVLNLRRSRKYGRKNGSSFGVFDNKKGFNFHQFDPARGAVIELDRIVGLIERETFAKVYAEPAAKKFGTFHGRSVASEKASDGFSGSSRSDRKSRHSFHSLFLLSDLIADSVTFQ